MEEQSAEIDWEKIDEGMCREWYFVSKIMSTIIPGKMSYFTYNELATQIKNDPNFKSDEDD